MLSGLIEGGIALAIAVVGAAVLVGQMRENSRKNEEDIKSIREALTEGQEAMRELIREYQEGMQEMLTKGMNDMKEMLDREKNNSHDNLNREIAHIKDLINISSNETREDIKRLEARQDQSNHLREKYALMAASLKSLHHRLDLEPPVLIEDDN